MPLAVILLAAGQGTRMRSDLPKVLHPLAGAPLLQHALATAAALGPDRLVVVTGHGAAAVGEAARAFDPTVTLVHQAEQQGTGHAVLQAAPALADFDGDALVLYADTPLLRPETLAAMAAVRAGGADLVALGFRATDPEAGYGRLVTRGDALERVVELADATPAERALPLMNSGVLRLDAATLFSLIAEVRPENAKREYYLTDVVGLACARGLAARVLECDEREALGVNSRAELAAAEAAWQARARAEAMETGVTLVAPETVFFAHDTVVGRDTVIEPHVVFGPGVTVETGALVHSFCHLTGCHISAGAEIGPFARLRPGAEIADRAKIGNFVEVKNAEIAEGAKVNHLSYIGDARVGERANIGAGTITCNYDGVMKHRTEIGPRAFVGSNTSLVAPVTIGADALIGAGSTITEDVADGALALARARQEARPGLALRLMERLRAIKSGTRH